MNGGAVVRVVGRLKPVLDGVATLLVIVLAGTVLADFWQMRAGPIEVSRAPAQRDRPPSAPLPSEPFSLDGVTQVGNRDAKVVLVEFSDFQCPYCARFATETLPELRKRYIDQGKELFAFRHLPLGIHSMAIKAAEAAECAGKQGRFWAMHNRLFSAPIPSEELLVEHSRAIGLDAGVFRRCLAGEAAGRVMADAAFARSIQVSGTPTFFLGTRRVDGRVTVVQRLAGAQPIAGFEGPIDRLLAQTEAASGGGR